MTYTRVCVLVNNSYHYVATTRRIGISEMFGEALEVALEGMREQAHVMIEINDRETGATYVMRSQ